MEGHLSQEQLAKIAHTIETRGRRPAGPDVTLDDVPVLDPDGDTMVQLTRLLRVPISIDFTLHFEELAPGKIRNAYRAQHLAPTLGLYSHDMKAMREPLFNIIGDLLSDLMHLSDLFDPENENEHTFESILASARNRYEEEVAGE